METAHLKPRATEGEVRFLRSSYLLLKGTFYLAKKVLLREAENVRQQTGRDLDCLLKDYEQQLKYQFRHKKHREKLFPPSGKTDVENWDISLLTGVLLIVFQKSLPDVDRKAIKKIKNERNDIYAHCNEASLNEVDYTDTCNNLKKAFNTLASGCSAAIEQECDDIIQTCLNGALDCKSHVELLIQLAEKDNMLVEIIAKIKPNELRERVLKALQQALQGQRRIEVKVVDSHLGICGTDEDEDNIALAENIIVTVINEAIRREQTCEENTCIREIIQEILDEITSHTGVKPISADKGCVIIRFDCCSNEQLFQFIIYMESKDMKERLNKLADSLSRLLNTKEKLQVSFSLSLETMKSILDEITPKVQREYKRSVHIPIQIESVEGIKRVFDLFEGGGLTNNLQKLSEALTKKVGAKINVKSSINMKQLKEALEDFEDPARQIGKTEECRSGEGATGHKGELYVNAEEGGDESTQINLTEHEEDIYVERGEPEEQSSQEKPSDHEEDINMEREEPEEQSIQEKPSDHEEEIYVDAKEPEEQNIQKKPTEIVLSNRECLFRLQNLVIDVGTDVSRHIFEKRLQGMALDDFLADQMENIYKFKQQRAITDAQFNLLYPPGGQPSNIAEFDITLILCLLKYLPFYKSIRQPLPISVEIDLNSMYTISSEIARISLLGGFQQSSFHTIKTDIEEVLLRLNATAPKPLSNLSERIKRYENKTLDPAAERKNQKIFNQWWQMELRLSPLRPRRPNMSIVPMKEKKYIKTDLKSIKAEEVTLWSLVQNQQCVFRLQSLVIDVGTDVLRNIFDQRLQGLALEAFLANEMENLKDLKQQRVITNAQFNLLYPPGGQPSNIAEFDITLILCLLRHLPSLRFNDFYKCAQRQMPDDVSVEDDIHRLCDIMNEIVRSSWSGRFHQPSFPTIKTEIEEVLLRLNKTVPKPLANLNERIKRYENKTLDPAAKKRNQKLFNQWEEMELTPVIPLRPIRTTVPKKRQDFGDINQQITMQNVKKIDTIGGFRSVMKNKQYIEQDVTSIKKDIKSLEADLKSIKGEEIEHGVSKGNEAENTYRQMKSDHEEDIFTEREEPEEQSIKENPSDETSTQKSNAKDESSDESSEENETEEILWNLVQNQNTVSRLQSLVIDVGTDVLRNILDHRLMHGLALDDFLTNEMENIKSLKQQKAITNAQFSLLCPPDGQPSNIAEFDITLILCLLIHLPSLRFNDFNKCTQRPMPAGVSGGTDIHRLCDIMNKIDSLSWNVMFNQSSFNTIKTEIEEVLLSLNKSVPKPLANLNERIKRYENKPLDHTAERRNKKIFDQWEFVWCGRLEPLERNRTIVTTMRQDFGDINPQVTIQNVNKIDMIGDFRSVMEEEQYVKQDVTSKKKEFKSIEADLKSIKTKDIEHGVSKGNEAESA